MSGLRDLAAQATPGPWETISESDDGFVIGQYNERWPKPLQDPVGRFRWEDARLIALAPELAVLCADMAEWIEYDWSERACRDPECICNAGKASALLARFAALNTKADA